MPWCDGCDRFWTVDAVAGHDDCPHCGAVLAQPDPERDAGAPWHFKLLIFAVVAYLGWRLVQLVVWLVGRF